MHQQDTIDLLLGALHHERGRVNAARLVVLGAEDYQSLLTLAAKQRVQPLLYHCLKRDGLLDALPPAVVDALKNAWVRTFGHNLRLQHEFHKIAQALGAVDIPIVALKGMFVAPAVYGSLALREMDDIDILVPQNRLQDADDVLVSLGYPRVRFSSVELDVALSHQLGRFVNEGVASVEVHWNITIPGRPTTIDPVELWQHAVPVQIAGSDVLALSPEDLLLHLCFHTSYHHQFVFGLRPSCDLAFLIARYQDTLDWDLVVRRAKQWGWTRGVYLALRVAQELVGAAVPAQVLEDLRSGDADNDAMQAARDQIFTNGAIIQKVTTNLAVVLKHRSIWRKVEALGRNVFVSRRFLAKRYGLPLNAWVLPFYYVVRMKELLLRYSGVIGSLALDDRATSRLAERTFFLSDWMSNK
jgi:hypothetical protein